MYVPSAKSTPQLLLWSRRSGRKFISITGLSCLNTSSWDLKITASLGNEERPSTSFLDVAGSSEMAHKAQNSSCKTEKHAQGR